MRILLIIFAIVVLNILFADKYLIPKTSIPSENIIIKKAINKVPQKLVSDSNIFIDENQAFLITLDDQTKNNAISNGLKEVTSYKAVEMPNGEFELTDLNILLQYKDKSYVENIMIDYGLSIIELMPSLNLVILRASDLTQTNRIMIALNSDSRVEDVSYNLVEMTEVPE
tara:strand:+ start:615 stop:1124 length:510 start_codon:yes stop_codon:yes gene_type:complete